MFLCILDCNEQVLVSNKCPMPYLYGPILYFYLYDLLLFRSTPAKTYLIVQLCLYYTDIN